MINYKNCIYILTNPLYAGYIKIGYASDLQARLVSLNTGMLRNFEPYAVYETPVKNADKQFHAIIDDLAPIVRARVINGQKIQDKEFFKLEPEQAYDILQHIAQMTGSENRLHRAKDETQLLPNTSPYTQRTLMSTDCTVSNPNQNISQPNPNKPDSYTIGNTTYPFTSWAESVKQHCECIIAAVGFSAFKSNVLNLKIGKNAKHYLFSETLEEMRGLHSYKFNQGELYILLNFSSKDLQKFHNILNDLYPQCSFSYETGKAEL